MALENVDLKAPLEKQQLELLVTRRPQLTSEPNRRSCMKQNCFKIGFNDSSTVECNNFYKIKLNETLRDTSASESSSSLSQRVYVVNSCSLGRCGCDVDARFCQAQASKAGLRK